MRFMIMVRANAVSESGAMPDESLMAAMTHYHEQLAQAGVLLDAGGLKPSRQGWRVRYHGGQATVVDGPFAESRELIAGYTLIQARSREEALEWARRFPAPFGPDTDAEIEVRPLFEPDDFVPATDPCAIVNIRRFDQPPEAVFAAISAPDRLARWWGPQGFRNRFEHCDIRTGGEWRFVMVGPDGEEYPNHSRFIEVTAPERMRLEHLSGHHFVLSIALAPEGSGTRLTWTQRFDTAEHRDRIAEFVTQANEQNLDRLQAELARAGREHTPSA